MSSHVMLGTSTTVSRSAEGLDRPSAVLKWSMVTAMELSTSAAGEVSKHRSAPGGGLAHR